MKIFFQLIALTLLNLQAGIAHTLHPRVASYEQFKKNVSPFEGLKFRNIGPSVMGGRITDIEVNPQNPNEFYVAYASGGVFHSVNNGQSFTPIFDHEASITIGDMAMDWKNHTLWVGTGEVNSSRSSYAGTGIYKSSDTGKNWTYCGLPESHHIGKVVLHPSDKNIAWLAVLGHLYTPNTERGIYKTIDGGKSWQQTLFVNDSTGCVDLLLDAQSPSTMYACAWTRTRTPWHFNGQGEASGIYKSTDYGNTWNLLTTPSSGFPTGSGVGRIGIAQCASSPQTLYAILDNQFHQEKKEVTKDSKLKPRELTQLSTQEFLNLEDKKIDDYLKEQGYPEKYTASNLKKDVRKQKISVKDIADWKLADADANLFDTPIKGAEVYRSHDGGKSWHKTHDELLDGVYFTYGYYFGTIAVSPLDPDKLWIAGYPILTSSNGGKSFTQIDGDNCHPDYHRIWVNPSNDNHIIACNDGGLNISYDNGKSWYKANSPSVGQFYAIETDNAKPYNVYGGLQDNGTWYGPSTHTESTSWHQSGQYAYKGIGDGDGMQVQVNQKNDNTVYLGYQFGNYMKYQKNNEKYTDIKPIHDIGQKPYRFNWQSPILLSKHNPDIFYMGSNCFHRSMWQGEELQTLSEDLTAPGHRKGNVPFGTLTTLSESPLQFGLLYTGSDDGLIHCSRDGGNTWTNISSGLPTDRWVSRVVASQYDEQTVYTTLNGYRQDDFSPYIFKSADMGKTWKSISAGLPHEPVNVLREDPVNKNILYVGTDNGLYVSMDNGQHYISWSGGLPRVAIHDINMHARENEIVLGTHGRSIYIASLDWVQKFAEISPTAMSLFEVDATKWNSKWGSKWASYATPSEPDWNITCYVPEEGEYHFDVLTENKSIVHSFTKKLSVGFNTISYPLIVDENKIGFLAHKPNQADNKKYYLTVGKYQLEIRNAKDQTKSIQFEVVEKK
jgi:photosystem II stability/assembly factor-like uncharacterized protein